MVIDLRKCIGCEACAITCQATNHLPGKEWRHISDKGLTAPPDRERSFMHQTCVHCSEPPCLYVCPTTATFRTPEGIVGVDYDLCIGCGYCIVACPYMARTIIFEHENGVQPREVRMLLKPDATSESTNGRDHTGVCTKCDFCLSRVESGLANGLQPGVAAEATPACVVSCSVNALTFGDLDDPDSEISQLIRQNKTVRSQEDLDTDPSVYYILP
jgi:phenylacetyl-CoA:acceptor oxidoreductase subunit 1